MSHTYEQNAYKMTFKCVYNERTETLAKNIHKEILSVYAENCMSWSGLFLSTNNFSSMHTTCW